MDPEVNEVDLFDEHIDMIFTASDAEKNKGRKTTEFWNIDLIDSEGIVKHAKISVREAIERSLNSSKIILRFNEELQVVGDGTGLLSGILEALDSDYSKFSICEKSWAKVQGKDMVYDDCIKNLNNRPEKISREHWRCFIDYHNNPATKEKYKQNALNQKKQLYTHTGSSKSLARVREEESQKQGRRVGRGEVWILKHKKCDGTYIHEEAQSIDLDETTRILSENDSLAQALGKERSGRVRGIGFGPIPSQLFYLSAQPLMDRAQTEDAQRMLFELQAEVTVEKLSRKAVEDELAAKKLKRKVMEDEIAAEKMKRQCKRNMTRQLKRVYLVYSVNEIYGIESQQL
ncbi:uncharacterized protein LOC130934347 [Arachis stenosperma]|uniref:uncharacterized protein LOC130934347 n=1 Tax=Arachis stenosperma TaxID=217475 RepID=UPI0025ACC6EF|nr:uncharacterized protein LOC130934347 [Arachis stenosperma]